MNKLLIAVDRIRWEEKKLYLVFKKKGIEAGLLNTNELVFDLKKIDLNFSGLILQRCISHYRNLYLSKIFEEAGNKVINSFNTYLIAGNKLLATLYLSLKGIKTPRTYIAFQREKAEEMIQKLEYKAVVKPLVGSWGRNVIPIFNQLEAMPILDLYEQIMHPPNNAYYIQELVDRPPRDIRMIVAGEEIIACVYRISKPGIWATNVAKGAYTARCELNSELEEIGSKVSSVFGKGILGIDIMESKEGYLVNDVNPTPEFKGAQSCLDYDIAEKLADYLKSNHLK